MQKLRCPNGKEFFANHLDKIDISMYNDGTSKPHKNRGAEYSAEIKRTL